MVGQVFLSSDVVLNDARELLISNNYIESYLKALS